jgi:(p)ppGpp synthase/HD superfamily hydrolase
MQLDNPTEEALIIATVAHQNQFDKLGFPYIYHPIMVSYDSDIKDDVELRIAAILHDVCEDHPRFTFDFFLNHGFSERIVKVLRHVTRNPEAESYDEFIERISEDKDSIRVKLADIRHNLSRMSAIENKKDRERMTKKYTKATEFLERKLKEFDVE